MKWKTLLPTWISVHLGRLGITKHRPWHILSVHVRDQNWPCSQAMFTRTEKNAEGSKQSYGYPLFHSSYLVRKSATQRPSKSTASRRPLGNHSSSVTFRQIRCTRKERPRQIQHRRRTFQRGVRNYCSENRVEQISGEEKRG